MPRKPRQEEAGGFFHVTTRAVRDEPLFLDDRDRTLFLLLLRDVVADTGWRCLAYCLMTTHYHLVVETPHPNLADGMWQLNGDYATAYNRRHRERGHAFGARYWSEPIRRESHLLETFRYVALNPVRAGIVPAAADWRWSSHRHVLDATASPMWLDRERMLELFGGPEPSRLSRYAAFVADAPDAAIRGRTSAR